MTRTLTDDNPTVDEPLAEELEDDFAVEESDDNGPEEQAADDEQSDENEPTLSAQEIWDNAVDAIKSGQHVDPAEFAAQFAQSGEKDAHEKLNELNNATTVELARDMDIDPADKGLLFSALAIMVEAVHGILPEKKVAKSGATVDPAQVARDNATRLLAVRRRVSSLMAKIETQLREQAVVAGLVTTDKLQELDDSGEQFAPALDTSAVTFTKKFGECIDYIAGVPGKAKGTGSGAGEPFTAGQVRFDNKGNACRFDGTNYWFTPKGGSEKAKSYTSSSTLAKKEVTGGTEVNGLKHFRYATDPTA